MNPTNVKKVFIGLNSQIQIEKLKVIYEKLKHKNVPNVDRIIAVSLPDEINPYLYLKLRGMCIYPKMEKEVIKAVLCVLEALMVGIN